MKQRSVLKKFGYGTIVEEQVKRNAIFELRFTCPEPRNDRQGSTKVVSWSDGNTNWRVRPMIELRNKYIGDLKAGSITLKAAKR